MDQVKDALKVVIQGESDAVASYTLFSEKAATEGYHNISTLFKALVIAEKIHIKNHRNALGEDFKVEVANLKPSSTIDNVKEAIDGEVEESKVLYPRLLKSIKKYTNIQYGKVAKLSMSWARSAEKEHSILLKMAYKSLKLGEDISFENIAVCQVCGNIVIDKNVEKECQICGHDTIFFQSIQMEAL